MNSEKIPWEKAAIYVLLFGFLGKLTGFIKDIILTSTYGASGLTDAYLVSQTIPGTIFQFVGNGLSACFIPIFYRIKNKDGEQKAQKYTNKIFSIICVFSAVIVAVTYLFTPQLVKLFAGGFDAPTADMAEKFTRVVVWGLFFSSVIYVLTTYLQAHQQFVISAVAATVNNVLIIMFIWISGYWGTSWLMVGCLVSLFMQAMLLWCSSVKNGFSLRCDFHWKDPNVKAFASALLPVVFSVSVSEINVLIDKNLASSVTGGISALTYANSLIMLVQGIIVQTLITVAYPNLAFLFSNGDQMESKKMTRQLVQIIIEVMVPVTVFYIVFSQQIVNFAYGRGSFDQSATDLTAGAMMCYAVGMCFTALREVVSRCFYAHGDTKTPTFNATVGVILNIGLNLCLSKWFGISGIALATSIAAIITSCTLWVSYNRKWSDYRVSLGVKKLGAVFAVTALAMIPAIWLNAVLPLSSILRFLVSCIVAVGIYLLLAIIFRFEILKYGKKIVADKKM